jgi:solute carrier family 13 (sodium-dependent dicarboxylate transporter), member 2/3/5
VSGTENDEAGGRRRVATDAGASDRADGIEDEQDAADLVDVPELGETREPRRITRRAVWGRLLGPVAAVATYLLLPAGEGGLDDGGRATTAIAVLMAVWWVTEALPLAVTALLPIVLFPLTGALDLEATTAPYANDLIFLFLGGFVLALAMQRWGLHRRIALMTVRAVGTRSKQMVGGFMLATAFLSMWVSNTATAVMMLPIGVSVLGLVAKRVDDVATDGDGEIRTGEGASNIATALMLGIAYAASIGSLGTIIGTPPNAFLIGYLSQDQGIEIGFGQWMLFAVPLSVVFLAIAWWLLTSRFYPPEVDVIPGGTELIQSELDELGPISPGERRVAAVFALTALAWVLNSLLADLLEGTFLERLDDAMIAVAAAIVLFAIPVDREHGVFAMDWATARRLPWGILLLFGGGLSLAAGISENGVDAYIGEQLGALADLPLWLLIAVVVASVIVLTELTSNTATAAALVPIIGGTAVALGLDPMQLAVPAAIAATCAFALPVATPPNAIVFGTGHVTVTQMARAGAVLNVIGVLLITLLTVLLVGPVLGAG